jgi:hypothetical protein
MLGLLRNGPPELHSAISLSSEHKAKWDSLRVAGVYLYLVGQLGGLSTERKLIIVSLAPEPLSLSTTLQN